MRYHWLVRHTQAQVDPTTKEDYIRVYDEWNEHIKQTVPSDQLLVYNVNEGWGPLCAFLNVPVPAEPFPCLNIRAQFQKERM